MRQGVRSDVSLERPEAKVFGNKVVQALEEKNQSSLSRRGFCCLFVQVYLQPLRGNSTNLRLLIASLKANMSCTFPPGLFLSSCDVMRLKSPSTSHGMSSGITIFLNQFKKLTLPSWVQGAYEGPIRRPESGGGVNGSR
jgi:hypothetical protein